MSSSTLPTTPSPPIPKSWHSQATITSPSPSLTTANATPHQFRLHYLDVPPHPTLTPPKATILLIHGFPQTWYQWRHLIAPLRHAGHRLIIPDYRGAGNSQAPPSNAGHAGGAGGGYTKRVLADDLHTLVRDVLGIGDRIHVVGHDIGAMVAHATASLVYVDCPLPGSAFYESFKRDQAVWHFTFHNVGDDLPERLVRGNERTYLRHFFDRLTVNPWAIAPGGEDEDVYVLAYSRPGALRAAFDTYRAFEEDGRENREVVRRQGKSRVPVLGLAGEYSFNNARNREQLSEFYEDMEVGSVSNSAHYVADENPEELAEKILVWLAKH